MVVFGRNSAKPAPMLSSTATMMIGTAGEVATSNPNRVIPKIAPILTLTKPTALAVVLHREREAQGYE